MHILDISIMILYFSVLIIVGVIGSKRAKTADDFIVAGRNLGHFMYLSCLAAVILGGFHSRNSKVRLSVWDIRYLASGDDRARHYRYWAVFNK